MFEFDYTKDYGLPISNCDFLRAMRIDRQPIKVDESIIVYDRLESEGVIRLYDYLGGSFYTPMNSGEMDKCTNVVLVAEISTTIQKDTKEIYVDRLFCEHGYDFEHTLFQQVLNFADLFDFRVCVLNIQKHRKSCDFMSVKCPA